MGRPQKPFDSASSSPVPNAACVLDALFGCSLFVSSAFFILSSLEVAPSP